MKHFNNTYKFIEHLVNLHGVLHFKFSCTSYGKYFDWVTDVKEYESLTKLKEVLYAFDEKYHDEFELEKGSSREYILQLDEEGLYGKINYKWDYSELGSKWSDQDLIASIRDEITTTLSNHIGISIDEFTDNYYYNIVFSTDEPIDNWDFLLADWDNDKPVEIPLSTWMGLTAAIVKISNANGANTFENECQFDYNFTHEDEGIIERWSNSMELETFLEDQESYEEKK